MEKGDILRQDTYEPQTKHALIHYDSVLLKVEAIQDSKLHYLPRNQCPNPACGDIGQHVWENKDRTIPAMWVLYCPYCHIQYYIHYYEGSKEEYYNAKRR